MITRDECDYIYDQAPIRIRDIDNATVGIAAGSYPGFLQVKNASNLEIVPVDGPVEFPDDEHHIFRNCKDIIFQGRNVPGITHGLHFRGGFLWYDRDEGEQTRNVTFEWVHIEPRSSWAAATYALPRKAVNAYISGITIRRCLINGGGNAIYLGGPEWVSEEDNEGLIHNVLVEYNHIYNTGDAIQLKSVCHNIPGLEPGYAIVRHNVSEHTRLERASAQSDYGIFSGPDGCDMYGNWSIGPEGDSFHASAKVEGMVRMWDNKSIMAGAGDHPWFMHGIQMNARHGELWNNYVFMPRGNGIKVNDRTRDCPIHDNVALFCGLDAIDRGGVPSSMVYNNHTEYGAPDYFELTSCDQLQPPQPPQPEPPSEPRYWSLGMRLTMIDDRLAAGDVILSEE